MIIGIIVGAAAAVDSFAAGVFVGRKWSKKTEVKEIEAATEEVKAELPKVVAEVKADIPDHPEKAMAAVEQALKNVAERVDTVAIAQSRIDAAHPKRG